MAQTNSSDSDTDGPHSSRRGRYQTEREARAAGFCGASNRHDEPCLRPAGWGTPGTSELGDRCKFHGGASTGPSDTEFLEGNDFAVGNDGGAPELNTNAEQSGAFSDLEKVEQRLTGERLHAFARQVWWGVRESRARRPSLSEPRRRRLARERALLLIRENTATLDVWSDEGRGLVLERDREYETADGETMTYTERVLNPAFEAERRDGRREVELEKALGLFDRRADLRAEAEENGP